MQAPLVATYLGHATVLLQCGELAVLTDPHLGRHLYGIPRRGRMCDGSTLPQLSAIVVSHTHVDHLDLASFKFIPSSVPVVVPPRAGPVLHRFVNNPVVELAHWVPHTPAADVTITPVPVRHYGGRYLPGVRFRHVSGYVIQLGPHTIYFAGDTSYGTHFREVGNVYAIDLALLPVGSFVPHWLAPAKPMNALECVQAAIDLKAKHTVPIHWGSFGLSRWGDAQVTRLQSLAAGRGVGDTVHVLEPGGGTWSWEGRA